MRRLAVACLLGGALVAPPTVGAEAETQILTVPSETFLSGSDRTGADSGASAQERPPLPAQLVHRLPAPTPTERQRVEGDAEGPTRPVRRIGIGRDFEQLGGTVPDIAALPWSDTPDGGLATALAVVSAEAAAVRVRLVIEGAPPGLEVRVYDGAGTEATVTSVPAHQLPAAGGSAELWTPTVPGDTVTVELCLPPDTAPGGLKVSIPVLSHLGADPSTTSHR